MSTDLSSLQRPRHPMSAAPHLPSPRSALLIAVRKALEQEGLMDAYKERPAYQQNDYVGWINRAKRQATKEKRLRQMLDELEKGGVYMGMEHKPSRKR